MITRRQHDGWDLVDSGSPEAEHTMLLLPGALATAAFFEDLMAQPKMSESRVRSLFDGGEGPRMPSRICC